MIAGIKLGIRRYNCCAEIPRYLVVEWALFIEIPSGEPLVPANELVKSKILELKSESGGYCGGIPERSEMPERESR